MHIGLTAVELNDRRITLQYESFPAPKSRQVPCHIRALSHKQCFFCGEPFSGRSTVGGYAAGRLASGKEKRCSQFWRKIKLDATQSFRISGVKVMMQICSSKTNSETQPQPTLIEQRNKTLLSLTDRPQARTPSYTITFYGICPYGITRQKLHNHTTQLFIPILDSFLAHLDHTRKLPTEH